uniref:AAA+ ATPase domain-containing protein n=1 Tax=Trichogramma kaykai TaxID=54128 RepID=A0ABD2W625_9HYME
MSMPWIHPWTSILSGPTGCGKTFFVKKFLNNLTRMSDTRFERVILYYSEWQPTYRELGNSLEFREGLPQTSDFADDPRPKLVIIDDLMRQSSSSGALCDLFTKNSHHNNLSVIFITQNIFHQGRGQRDVSLNSHYIVLFRNVRDRAQICHLARQVYPEDPRFLQEAYSDATSRAYEYLLLDLKQTTTDNCRLRTGIFPDDTHHYVYVPKKPIKEARSAGLLPVLSL